MAYLPEEQRFQRSGSHETIDTNWLLDDISLDKCSRFYSLVSLVPRGKTQEFHRRGTQWGVCNLKSKLIFGTSPSPSRVRLDITRKEKLYNRNLNTHGPNIPSHPACSDLAKARNKRLRAHELLRPPSRAPDRNLQANLEKCHNPHSPPKGR